MAIKTELETEGSLKWRFLPLTVDLSQDPKDTFSHSLMPHVRPDWSESQLRILNVDGNGLSCSNQLLGFYQDEIENKEGESPKEKKRRVMKKEGSVVLVRINGQNTEHFTDRRKEVVAMVTLHELGQGNPPLYFEFSNGICFGYVPGHPISEQDYKSDAILISIMSAIAHLHTIRLPDGYHGNSSVLPEMFRKLLALLPMSFKDEKINEAFCKTFHSLESLSKETSEVLKLLNTFKSPLHYCHNDLQHGNIIYNETSGKCVIIDHEFGGLNYLSCELGDLFSEQAGLDMPDYGKYPNETIQKNMIRIYLIEAAKIKGKYGLKTL